MNTKTVYQLDQAGMYVGETVADESPMEPGQWLMPAGTIDTTPPAAWPDDQHPRWNGSVWELVKKPAPATADPVAILAAFLDANPDVRALIDAGTEI